MTKELASPSSKAYYPALTGVRAIAASLVFFHHFNPFEIGNATSPRLPQTALVGWLRTLVEQWHIGVSIFFVLSGFLIATRYLDKIEPSWRWARFYMQNRFARIYPLYIFVTVLTVAFWYSGFAGYHPVYTTGGNFTIHEYIVAFFLNVTLLRGFFLEFLFIGAPTAWSLTVEEFFYITAPFLILGLKKHSYRFFLYPAVLLGIGTMLVIAASFPPVWLFGFMKDLKFMLNWTYFGRCIEFMIGIGLAFFIKKHPAPGHWRGPWLTVAGLCWVIASLIGITYAETGHPRYLGLNTYGAIALNNLVLPIGVAGLFWGLIRERSLLRRVLETKLLSELGKISYAFYLIHGGCIYLTLLHFGVTNLLVHFLVSWGLSALAYYFVEEPLQLRLRASPLPSRSLQRAEVKVAEV
jgi:peptidoglycan/LPS O-acetylase OafA/YrhL